MSSVRCVLLLAGLVALASAATLPPYYIQAEVVLFDSGDSNACGVPGEDYVTFTETALGSKYYKGLYRAYTDESFDTQVERPAELEHLGMLGPIISARVGDVVTVVFRNALDFPVNLVPTGFVPEALDDPAAAANFTAAVPSNTTVTLQFRVPQDAGPQSYEADTKLWLYKSMVDPTAHASLGLVGPILIANATVPMRANNTLAVPGPGRDIITITQIVYEYNSPLYERNMAGRTAASFGLSDTELQETQTHHTINGKLFCAIAGLEMVQGETVRWHAGSVGSDLDLHNVHWHGNTITYRGYRADIVKMIPGSYYSMPLEAYSVGTWMFHCHVNDHFAGGMIALYTVHPNATVQAAVEATLDGATRTYFIQAEEDIWDYAPQGAYMCNGAPENYTTDQLTYIGNFSDRIGSRYIKGLYREYTDDTYTTRVERSAEEQYLGLLGPIIKAEVGDTIQVHFKNTLPYNVSIHPHGVWYNKSNEGTPYNDGTTAEEKLDDAVPQDGSYTYTWHVPEFSGPGPRDLSTKAWMYHSHTEEAADTYAGMVGAIIIGGRGAFDPDTMIARDVDGEIVLFFSVMNEEGSLFLDANMDLFLANADHNTLLNDTAVTEAAEGGESSPAGAFAESNLMHSINGFMFCNGPHIPVQRDGVTRVHIISLGTEADVHAPSFVRQNFWAEDQMQSSVTAMPGSMQSLDIIPRGGGTNLIACRTTDHINAGMIALYDVVGDAAADGPAAEVSKTYYIQAEEVIWNYAPLGADACSGEAFDEAAAVMTVHSNLSIGAEAIKAIYRQYEDATFSKRVEQPRANGQLGPTLTAEVGQSFSIVFRNALDMDVNLLIDASLIPIHDPDMSGSAPVAPNQTYTYTYVVPDSVGPRSRDLSTAAAAYGSGVDLSTHQYAGLYGLFIVGRPGAFGDRAASTDPADAVPLDVDLLYPLVFLTGDESVSPYLVRNLQRTALDPIGVQNDTNFANTVVRANINGYLFCNQPGLTAPLNATVRFAMLGLGTETDLHAPAFTANPLLQLTTHQHSMELLPSIARTADIRTQTPGNWLIYTETHVHYDQGMRSWLNVTADAKRR